MYHFKNDTTALVRCKLWITHWEVDGKGIVLFTKLMYLPI